jgi:hypothetical protein
LGAGGADGIGYGDGIGGADGIGDGDGIGGIGSAVYCILYNIE